MASAVCAGAQVGNFGDAREQVWVPPLQMGVHGGGCVPGKGAPGASPKLLVARLIEDQAHDAQKLAFGVLACRFGTESSCIIFINFSCALESPALWHRGKPD